MKIARKIDWPDPVPSPCGEWLELPEAPLTLSRKGAVGDSYEVIFPVSTEYNGGVCYEGKWYRGFRVPKPELPEGYELISMGVGHQMNSRPPYATMLLRRKKDETCDIDNRREQPAGESRVRVTKANSGR